MRGLLLLQTLFAATAALAVDLDALKFQTAELGFALDSAVVPFQAYRDDAGEVLPLSQGVSVLVAESYPEQVSARWRGLERRSDERSRPLISVLD